MGLVNPYPVKNLTVQPVGYPDCKRAGSILLGFVAGGILYGYFSRWWRVFLTTGVAGSFTTFSTLAYETPTLAADYSVLLATANVALNPAGGLLGVYLGKVLAGLLAGLGG